MNFLQHIILIGACLTWLTGDLQAQPTSSTMEFSTYPFSVKTLTLESGQEIAYSDVGEGAKTLVFVHGLGSYSPAWQKVINGLKDQYKCIAIDLPGYGKSGEAVETVSMSGHAKVVAEVIEKLELGKVVLAGHSMGAQIVMTCALETETEIEGLVLLAPAGFERFTEAEATSMLGYVSPEGLFATSADDLKPRFSVNFHGNALPEDAVFMYEDRVALKQDSARYMIYCQMYAGCVKAMLNGPVADRLAEIDIPVLTMYGEDDLLIPNRFYHPTLTTKGVGEKGISDIPSGTLLMLPECGHFVLWDQAAKVGEAIEDWLLP